MTKAAKKGKSTAKASKTPVAAREAKRAAAGRPLLTVRHYCQGIGDCHLITIPRGDGGAFRMLIDCGIHSSVEGGSKRISAIANDIKDAVGDEVIDVLLVTHEHWDHVSGFKTAADVFKTIRFGEVWMGWTENPKDDLARKLEKYKGQALAALTLASNKLAASPVVSRHLAGVSDSLHALLGFQFGAKGDDVRSARNAAAAMAKGKPPRYLEPGVAPLTIDGLPNLRIYVLGPPRDEKLLRLEESQAEMYHFGVISGWEMERTLSAAMQLDDGNEEAWALASAPFAENQGHDLADVLAGRGDVTMQAFVREHYAGVIPLPDGKPAGQHLSDQSWRRIDADWLGMASDLALQLDRGVNNTSVVLAFEFIDTGGGSRVVLFPGDAQIGNWKSWHTLAWSVEGRNVTAKDLLARTVYLKVAHHGSHNATPSRLGLELMGSKDLSAFIPVNKADAVKVKWHEMPFETILTELAQRTSGRVVRADDAWLAQPHGKPPFVVPSGSILASRKSELWVELDVV